MSTPPPKNPRPPQDPVPKPRLWSNWWTLTTIPKSTHVQGFTLLDNIYLRNGTFYVVTHDRALFPPRENLLSRPVDAGSEDGVDSEPTDEASLCLQLRFISPDEVFYIFGQVVKRIKGLSVIVYDPPQLMKHCDNWFGEVILGAWRVYSHLSPEPVMWKEPPKHLPLPRRFILPFMDSNDLAGMHGPLMRLAFPDATIEQAGYWDDLKKIGTTVVFERVMLVNRNAAHKHPFAGVFNSMIGAAMNVSSPRNFWAPVRRTLWQNILPRKRIPGMTLSPKDVDEYPPMVTYISRQGFDRRLAAADHDGLISALRELKVQGICDFRVAVLERMTLSEQLDLVATTTILVGVHGSGLTHQLWMPGKTTIEIVVPNGYSFNYELLARNMNMGHRHYTVWNDTFVTYEEGTYHAGVNFPDGFDGVIPVHGPTIAGIIRDRLRPRPLHPENGLRFRCGPRICAWTADNEP
ncbi:hypothetical protein B0H11DRAFT_1752292 [Mycena galericulata]|nr:hypothetical protein B0H11DRAFT_1752292 [Mycena galericulata]